MGKHTRLEKNILKGTVLLQASTVIAFFNSKQCMDIHSGGNAPQA